MGIRQWFCDHEWEYRGVIKECTECGKITESEKYEDCDHNWEVIDTHTFTKPVNKDDNGELFIIESDVEKNKCTKCNYIEQNDVERRKKYLAFDRVEVVEE